MKDLAAVVLAAGSSSRYGSPKQLLDWEGRPLLAHVTARALAAGFFPVVVVVAPDAPAVVSAVEEAFREEIGRGQVRIAVNWEAGRTLSGSVRSGLAALPPSCDGACLMQGDAPLVTEHLLGRLMTLLARSGQSLAHPTVEGNLRPPVLFSRRLFAELCTLQGDSGGRVVAARHQSDAATVELEQAHVLLDIDTPADYKALKRSVLSRPHNEVEPARCSELASIRSLIVDMDGVLWHGDTPLPGISDFFAFLRANKIGFMLATNNSSRMPSQYSAKLAQFGVQIPPEQVLTSSLATAAYVTSICGPSAPVYVIGGDGIRQALVAEGLVLTDKGAECVVVGWDRQLTWEKLRTASLLIHGGARFVGTNPDKSYPAELGPAPGNGAQLAAIEATTGVEPIVVGKPEPWLYEVALRRMGAAPNMTAVVGDRLETDIEGGKRAGLLTILLLSGIASADDVSSSPTAPDLVLRDVRDLVAVWGEVLRSADRAVSG